MAAPAIAQECILTAARSADAYPQLYGPAATATASFSETCGAHGCTYALAFAEGYDGTLYNSRTQRQDELCDDGTAPAASVSVDDVIANNNCEAYAIGRVKVRDSQDNWAYFITEDTDTTCRTPLTVEVSGANAFSVGYGQCRTIAWSTTTNRTPTTWAWTWDTVAVGSDPSYSRLFCSSAKYTYTRSYTLEATVSDGYDSASDTDTITVTYYGYRDCETPVADDVAKSTAYSLAGCSVQ